MSMLRAIVFLKQLEESTIKHMQIYRIDGPVRLILTADATQPFSSFVWVFDPHDESQQLHSVIPFVFQMLLEQKVDLLVGMLMDMECKMLALIRA